MNSAEKIVVIATGNAHKVEEFNRLAADAGLKDLRFISAKECVPEGMPKVVEDAGTFEGNARLKALALRKIVPADYFVMADDSGLCVDFLDGAPGVETAYYAGPDATHAENRAKLLEALKGVPAEKRGAYFLLSPPFDFAGKPGNHFRRQLSRLYLRKRTRQRIRVRLRPGFHARRLR